MRCHQDRRPHYQNHIALEAGPLDGRPGHRKAVDAAAGVVHQRRIVMLPPGLELLGATVVVNREQGGTQIDGGRRQVQRRLPAVGADLQQRAGARRCLACRSVQGEPFVVGHEALHVERQLEEVAGPVARAKLQVRYRPRRGTDHSPRPASPSR